MSSLTIVIIALALAVLVVGAIAAVFVFYAPFGISRISSRPGPVEVTGLFLAIIYPDSASSYFGPAYRFLTVPGPIYLQHG